MQTSRGDNCPARYRQRLYFSTCAGAGAVHTCRHGDTETYVETLRRGDMATCRHGDHIHRYLAVTLFNIVTVVLVTGDCCVLWGGGVEAMWVEAMLVGIYNTH